MMEKESVPADKKTEEKKGGLAVPMPDMGKMNPFGGDDTGSDRTVTPWGREPTYEECCCCYCHCSDKETKDVTCCGCFPIRCGVLVIGILTVSFTLYMFCASFFFIMNEYIKWWFPFVSLILMAPAIIGSCNFLGWFTKDCKRTRGNLTSALVLNLVSWSLVMVWQVAYFLWLYKNDTVYLGYGTDTESYQAWSKKGYIFWLLAEGSVAITLLAYFLCVIRKYINRFGETPEEKKDDEEKKA
jgi:hypothetical protein